MALRLLGGDTGDGGSPRLYRDGDDYLVQGYAVTEPRLLAALRLPAGEAAVRVPGSLWKYLPAGPRMNRSPGGSSGQVAIDCGHHGCRLAIRPWHAAEEEEQMAGWPTGTSGLAGGRAAPPWLDLVRAETYREKGLSRVRMVLEPVSESMWFGGAGTSPGIEVDEQERWLARRRASALRLPASDLRAIDEFRALARHSASAVAALRAISEQHARYGPD
jgi:hypothetical protein